MTNSPIAEDGKIYFSEPILANSVPARFASEEVMTLYPSLERATPGSCAFDLRAVIPEDLTLPPGDVKLIGTGIHVDMTAHPGLGAVVLPRSGLGHKHGIVLGNLVGLIDNDYQGEIMVSLWNRSPNPYTVERGERIAQLAFLPFILVNLLPVESFDGTTQRGAGGFGHSGKV